MKLCKFGLGQGLQIEMGGMEGRFAEALARGLRRTTHGLIGFIVLVGFAHELMSFSSPNFPTSQLLNFLPSYPLTFYFFCGGNYESIDAMQIH